MIAIGVRVDQRADARGGLRFRTAHGVEHFARELQVEERIDEHRLAPVYDEACIAPSPSAVRLQIRVASVAEVMQSLGVGPFADSLGHVEMPSVVGSQFALIPFGRPISNRDGTRYTRHLYKHASELREIRMTYRGGCHCGQVRFEVEGE